MPSATSQSGFSLIELMMAIFIMALTTSLIVMTLPPRAGLVETEAEKLSRTITLAADRAMVSGQLTGVKVSSEGYELVRRQNDAWQVIPDTVYELPGDMSLVFKQADRTQYPDDWPEIRFDPVGQTVEAELVLRGKRGRATVFISEAMQVSVVQDEN